MKEDRFAPPSYNYEPLPETLRPRNERGAMISTLVVWGFLALTAAFEIYAAIQLYPEHIQ